MALRAEVLAHRGAGGGAIELALSWLATAAWIAGSALAWRGLGVPTGPGRPAFVALQVALAAQSGAIGVRWAEVGHGPYTTLYEILASNIWSLGLVFALAWRRVPAARSAAAVVLPILATMSVWMLLCDRRAGHVPPTYDTIWLWVHMFFGKVFLGSLLVALGLAALVLARRGGAARRLARLPDDVTLDAHVHRFMALAVAFETPMLIVGAIWAQDAWGRYWAWDPLETWAFLTWLSLVMALHARASFKLPLGLRAALVPPVFVLAFLTFFGVPFLSTVPHQGAV